MEWLNTFICSTYYGLLCIAQETLDLEVAYDVVGGSKAAPLIPKVWLGRL